jgi:hypothetical protein
MEAAEKKEIAQDKKLRDSGRELEENGIFAGANEGNQTLLEELNSDLKLKKVTSSRSVSNSNDKNTSPRQAKDLNLLTVPKTRDEIAKVGS